MQHNENHLILAAAKGCTSSFEQLISPIESKMLSIAAGLVSTPDEADDIFQEAMINAYKGLPKFRKDSQFKTWLYRIVVNAAMSHRRKLKSSLKHLITNRANKDSDDPELQAYEQYTTGETSETELHNEQLSLAINRALACLAPNERIAFVLCHQQGFKIVDAAKVMCCTDGTVKSYLFRARERMRDQLKEFVE